MLKEHYVRLNDSGEALLTFHDRLPAMPTERVFKDSGAMIAPCVIARTGIMEYRARELGPQFANRNPDDIIRIATFEEDLFDADSLATYRSSPITNGHPDEDVTVENAKELAKGSLEGMPVACKDAGELKGVLVINDADLIAEVKAGKAELSSGHKCRLVLNDTGSGDWDAKKVGIKNNHIAVEKTGRAGHNVRIADAADELVALKDSVKELETKLADAETKLAVQIDAAETTKVTLADRDTRIAELELQLKDAVPKDQVNELVKGRVQFIAEARTLCDSKSDFASMTEVEVKREVLTKLLDKDYSAKDDAFINMRYEVLREEGAPEDASSQFRQVLKDSAEQLLKDEADKNKPSPAEEARQKMIARNAGKTC